MSPVLRYSLWALLVFASSFSFQARGASFTDVTAAAGITHVQQASIPNHGTDWQPYMTGGAAAGDFDGDGWVDLYFTRLDDNDLLYRNRGDGTFEDVTVNAFGVSHLSQFETNGAAWGDIDNDNDLDLYVTSLYSSRYHLFVNNGDGSFAEEAVSRGAAIQSNDQHFGFSASFGDYDHDGFLDLHTTEWRLGSQNPASAPHNTRLLRNLGASNPGHFTDVTISAGVATDGHISSLPNSDSQAFTSRFVDMDADGHVDLAIASDHQTSRLFWNNGDGTFTETPSTTGIGTDQFGMGSAIGDIDNDGDFDWFVTSVFQDFSTSHNGNRLYLNQGDRTFADGTDAAVVRDGGWGWGVEMLDYDNDGDLDVVETNGQAVEFAASVGAAYGNEPMRFWENDGTGVFSEVAALLGVTDDRNGKGLLSLDYDRDGDLDIVVVNNRDSPVLYRNDSPHEHNWLQIELTGTDSNMDGVGALIIIDPDSTVSGDEQMRQLEAGSNFLGQSPTMAHFGLGSEVGSIDEITVNWPSGRIQRFFDTTTNQQLMLTEWQSLIGDYDGNRLVDQSDYDVWFGTFGSTTNLAADGNGNGIVDAADFTVWRDSFLSATFVPEPSACVLALTALFLATITRFRLVQPRKCVEEVTS